MYSHFESYLGFGLTQVDEITSGTTIYVVCPTQLMPWLLHRHICFESACTPLCKSNGTFFSDIDINELTSVLHKYKTPVTKCCILTRCWVNLVCIRHLIVKIMPEKHVWYFVACFVFWYCHVFYDTRCMFEVYVRIMNIEHWICISAQTNVVHHLLILFPTSICR